MPLTVFGIEHFLGLVWLISQEIIWVITSQPLLLLSLLQSSQARSYSTVCVHLWQFTDLLCSRWRMASVFVSL